MVSAPIPTDEARRLARLHDLLVLDSPAEPVFDSITRMAGEICGVPIALISLIDEHRQWFKANVGLPGVSETPRDIAFCAHAITGDTLFEVEDARQDPRFVDNPLVTEAPDIRFYAGAPLTTADGARIGTLCVIDRKPHRLSAEQSRQLESLAKIAVQALEMRSELAGRVLAARSGYEVELAESEARHRAILDAQSELISQALPDGTLIYANPAYAQHFGSDVDALIGSNLFDYVEPADRDTVRSLISRVLETGERAIGVNRMASAGGEEEWFAWTNTRQIDAAGRTLLHSVGRDISAQKRAEKALRDSEALLQRTGRVAGVGGWQLDLQTGALTWSAQTRAIHEVDSTYIPTVDEAVKFYAPEARQLIEAAVRAAIEDGKAWDLELPLVTAKGRRIWVRAQGECELDASGAPLRLVGAFQDITAHKQLEQRVVDDERFLRLMTDSLPQRIAYLDRDLRYRFVNDVRARVFGLKREQIIGKSRAEITGEPTPPEIQSHFDGVLAGKAQRFEFEEHRTDGTRRIDCQFLPDVGDDGVVRGFFTSATDITERSRAEQRLLELTAILENSPDFVVQTDWRGSITYMNPAVRAATGLAPDAPLDGLNFAQFNSDATNRHFAEVIVPAVKSHGAWVGETAVKISGERELPVSQLVVAHRDELGRVARYSSVIRDISAATRSRHDLQMQTATLSAVTEAVPATVAVIGSDLRYRFVNSAFERWIGLSRDKVLGRTVSEVLSAADLRRSQPWIDRVLAGEAVQFERTSPRREVGRNLVMSGLTPFPRTGIGLILKPGLRAW
ncbi:PAS domain S-box protein [Piscinibacter sakaiensis]|uniref:PAS domain S-box protein n=1 Tax=Piscinibacter sakaiensis TaxID=1547922 RepID=UPI003AAF6621